MTVRLRPHHLLCMLTYVGRGYTPDFTANYDAVVERLGAGEDIRLVAGPDDVCTPLLATPGCHCHNESAALRDDAAADAVGRLLGTELDIDTSLVLDADRLARLRAAFADETIRAACTGCEWSDLCTSVAADGFAGARLSAVTRDEIS